MLHCHTLRHEPNRSKRSAARTDITFDPAGTGSARKEIRTMMDEQKLRLVFDSLFANQNQINMQILQRVWFRNVLYYLGEQ